MKKLFTFLSSLILLACLPLVAQDVVVKPIGFTTAAGDGNMDPNWNSIDPPTDNRYKMVETAVGSGVYKLTITLNKLYRTNKWQTKHGVNPPADGVANEGWFEHYSYQIVFLDEYDSPVNTTARKAFQVPQNATAVTFYAKKDAAGKLLSLCDAQEFRFLGAEAGANQGNLLSNIGQEYTSKGIDAFDQKNANAATQAPNNGFNGYQNGNNSDFGGKYDIRGAAVQGRGIITLHYPTLSFSAEKSIDELQAPAINVSALGSNWTLATINGSSLGTITDGDPKNITFSGSLKTVVTKGSYPLSQAINTNTVDVSLCYQVTESSSSDEPTTLKKALALGNGATTFTADWNLAASDILEGLNLANGSYSLSFWIESKYKGQYGEDVLTLNNGGTPFTASFAISNLTSIEQKEKNEAKVSALNGSINVSIEGESIVEIYSISGKLVNQDIINNEYSVAVQAGVYIVKVNGKSYKLIVQ